MVLMYCYGSSFHANRFRLATTAASAFVAPAAIAEKVIKLVLSFKFQVQNFGVWIVFELWKTFYVILLSIPQIIEHEKILRGSTSRTMAAISLGFIVIVTPYTIQEVVAACTGSKVISALLWLNLWTRYIYGSLSLWKQNSVYFSTQYMKLLEENLNFKNF